MNEHDGGLGISIESRQRDVDQQVDLIPGGIDRRAKHQRVEHSQRVHFGSTAGFRHG